MGNDDRSLIKPTAAPAEFYLGGKTILLYPLRNRDWGKMEQWMRTQIINAAKSAILDDELTEKQRQLILSTAYKEAAKISLASCFFGEGELARRQKAKKDGEDKADTTEKGEPLMAFLETFEGMLRVAHLSARSAPGRAGRPQFSLDELDEIVEGEFKSLTEMYQIAFSLSFPLPAAAQSDKEVAEAQAEADSESAKNSGAAANQDQ